MRRPVFLLILITTLISSGSLYSLSDEHAQALAQPSKGDGGEELEELGEEASTPASPRPSLEPKTPQSGGRRSAAGKSTRSSTMRVTEAKPDASQTTAGGGDLYMQQIQRIETQVNELKEEIFRSRTRLAILKESVLASGLSGTELRIVHRNEMGANFKLERALYILDGDQLRQLVDRDGNLDQQEEIEILSGPIQPGPHNLQVELIYRGNGFGVFSYLQSYRFTLNDSDQFRADEGKRITITAIGYERSGITLELKDRPDIRFERSVVDLDEDEGTKKGASQGKDRDTP